MKRVTLFALLCAVGLITAAVFKGQGQQSGGQVRVFNTVKEKLAEGKQVVGERSPPRTRTSIARWRAPGLISFGSRCSTAR